jgi:hypothetical protein
MSAMGKASQRVQAARRMAEMTPEILQDLTANPHYAEGDSLGSLTWHNHRTGRVTKWIVERGPRLNNYRLRSPDGRKSKPHGMAWMLEKIRAVILRR